MQVLRLRADGTSACIDDIGRTAMPPVSACEARGVRPYDLAYVVNMDAGFSRKLGFARTLEAIRLAMPNRAIDLTVTQANGLSEAVLRAAERRPPAVAVVGGDGTARTALQLLTPLGVPVVPLPGGSLNRLSRAVFKSGSMRAALLGLQDGAVAWLPGARIGARTFFVASGYGNGMRLNALREFVRQGRLGDAWRVFDDARSGLLDRRLRVDGQDEASVLALVSIGALDAAFGLAPPAARRELEVAVACPQGWRDAVGILATALRGTWRTHRSVSVRATQSIRLSSAWGPIPALLDGEPDLLPHQFDIAFDARAGLVYAPKADRALGSERDTLRRAA